MSRALLMILDGWGIGNKSQGDAIHAAQPSYFNQLWNQYPHSKLTTHGVSVGLPDGQMGNSEVGHLNIGAGRIVYQSLQRINQAMQTLEFEKKLKPLFEYCKNKNKPLHLVGLISDGGIHSHIEHAIYMAKAALQYGLSEIYLHAITDGRDTDPKSGQHYISKWENIFGKKIPIVSICGRYYAMDRDKRWERTAQYYQCLIDKKGKFYQSAMEAIVDSYNQNITDEFILPCVLEPNISIDANDAVFCFNFRTDRCRQIVEVLTQKENQELHLNPLPLFMCTMMQYDKNFQDILVLFEKEDLKNTLGQVLEEMNKTQVRIAETEKYPHVTFFFSGGREDPFAKEKRILIPSPKVATYDLQPQMSALQICEALIKELAVQTNDCIIVNYANPDMVGHTGNFDAVVTAIKTIDSCLEKAIPVALANNVEILIIADHGNAEYMINDDGSINTAHTTNEVPCIYLGTKAVTLRNGILADVAPTLLEMMNIPKHNDMTGVSLFQKKLYE